MRLDEALALRDAAARPVLEQIRADREQSDYRIRQFLDRLERELYSNDFTVSRLVRKLKIKGTGSLERFTALTGLAPAAYVEEARHETAAHLLIGSELSIETIAELVGFAAATGFGRAFRRWSGMSPSELRKQALEAKAQGAGMPDLAFARRRWLRKIEEQTLEPEEVEKVLAAEAAARGGEVAAAYEAEKREAAEAAFAVSWWARSRELPAAELERAVREGCDFSTSAVFQHLRQASLEEGRCDRRRGLEVAKLAMASLGSLSPAVSARDRAWLEARAWLAVGDAHRLVFDLAAAEEALANAAVLLVDPEAPWELRAELAWMRSGLRRYQRRLPEALAFAEEALASCLVAGPARATALLMRGNVWCSMAAYQRAAADFRSAAESLGPSAEPYLQLSARLNLAHALAECDRHEAAERELAEAAALAARLGQPEAQCHTVWLQGLLAAKTGRETEAEKWLHVARDGFDALKDGGHLAIVLLDLALVLLRRLERGQAAATLTQALPHLEALHLEDEGLVALKLLRKAVVEGDLSIGMLQRLRTSARQWPSGGPPEVAAVDAEPPLVGYCRFA